MRHYLRRIGQSVFTMLSGLFLTYALYRIIPGSPLQNIIADIVERNPENIDSEQIARIAETMTGINPEEPIIVGFFDYVAGIVLRGDFGTSILYQDPVFDILFRAMPWSIFISVYGLMLGITSTILVGVVMAWHEGSVLDKGGTVLVLLVNSVPYYVAAIVMLSLLAFQWGLFPAGGHAPRAAEPGFNPGFMIGILYHGALPILSMFLLGFASGSLGMRANTVSVVGSDYLRSARLRGVSTNRILTRYLTRNAILPLYTGFVIGIGVLFSSSVITEQIFAYQGAGWFLFEAATNSDYPLVMGAFIFFGGVTVLGILVADLTYGLIDPRAESGSSRETF
jgi:peptide/nickel transport system permease protein